MQGGQSSVKHKTDLHRHEHSCHYSNAPVLQVTHQAWLEQQDNHGSKGAGGCLCQGIKPVAVTSVEDGNILEKRFHVRSVRYPQLLTGHSSKAAHCLAPLCMQSQVMCFLRMGVYMTTSKHSLHALPGLVATNSSACTCHARSSSGASALSTAGWQLCAHSRCIRC